MIKKSAYQLLVEYNSVRNQQNDESSISVAENHEYPIHDFQLLSEATGYIYLTNNPFSQDCPCQRLIAKVLITQPIESETPAIQDSAHYYADEVKILSIFDPRNQKKHRWACYLTTETATPWMVGIGSRIKDSLTYYLNVPSILGNVDCSLNGSNFSGSIVRSIRDGRPLLKTEYYQGRKIKQIRWVYDHNHKCQMYQIFTFNDDGTQSSIKSVYFKNGRKIRLHKARRRSTELVTMIKDPWTGIKNSWTK